VRSLTVGVKNIKEDIIYNIVNEVLKSDKDIKNLKLHKDDVVAYILNRIPPKYITSERGVLHGKLEARYIIQQKTDILLLLYEAIEVFSKRRPTEKGDEDDDVNIEKCRFPHIFGEILEETTFTIVTDVEVSLLYDGKPSKMINQGWKNPYITNKATMGFYHFWPIYEDEMGDPKKVSFQLDFKHPKFKEKKLDINVHLLKRADIGKSHVVPIILMKLQEGVASDFLYD
jgi:competence protein ComFB